MIRSSLLLLITLAGCNAHPGMPEQGVAYRDGSLYQAVSPQDYFWLAIGLVMTAVLLLGLLVRQKSGPGGIGFESLRHTIRVYQHPTVRDKL